jgi:methyltransferase (TIGR00027 family)
MKPGRASRTAGQNALFRALAARQGADRRVANDQLAVRFLPQEYRVLAELARVPALRTAIEGFIDHRWPCVRGGVVARTRLLDDTISEDLSSVSQILILGAGLDTRPYRLPEMATVQVFEVDHPDTQATKKRVVARLNGDLPRHVRYVPVVFGTDDPLDALTHSGFVRGAATLVLWEGVTNYLDAESVDGTFRLLADVVAPGSPVLFTYVDRGMLDGSASFDGAATTMSAVQRMGEPFTFGFDPAELTSYLAERGFEVRWDMPVSAIGGRYYTGRPPSLPAYYHVVKSVRR